MTAAVSITLPSVPPLTSSYIVRIGNLTSFTVEAPNPEITARALAGIALIAYSPCFAGAGAVLSAVSRDLGGRTCSLGERVITVCRKNKIATIAVAAAVFSSGASVYVVPPLAAAFAFRVGAYFGLSIRGSR